MTWPLPKDGRKNPRKLKKLAYNNGLIKKKVFLKSENSKEREKKKKKDRMVTEW